MKTLLKRMTAAGCALLLCMPCSVTARADELPQVSARKSVLVMTAADYDNIAVSKVSGYVNIRSGPGTANDIVGKIYNNCAARILGTEDAGGEKWYHIQSGSVTGYIKAQYFVTGEDAAKLARSIGREYVNIDAEGLRLRESPDLSSEVLTTLISGSKYRVTGESGDFYCVEVDADLTGYVAREYCSLSVEFDEAISMEEERQRRDEKDKLKAEAENAIAAWRQIEEEAGGGRTPETDNNITVVEENGAAASGTTGSGTQDTDTGSSKTVAAGFAADTYQRPASADASGIFSGAAPGSAAGDAAKTGNSMAAAAAITAEGSSGQTSGTIVAGSQEKSSSGVSGPASGSQAGVVSGNGPASGTSQTKETGDILVSAKRQAIIAYAKQFIGNPYVFGGTSLTNGTDCSGFTQAIYAHFGIETGRSSRDQAANGKEISVEDANPGDLLFYSSGSSGYINHVAMYIGDGQIIHAGSSATGICITRYNYRTPCKAVTFLD